VQVPWAREGSGLTLMMEAFMMLLSAEMPVNAMADLLDEHDTGARPVNAASRRD
jgi:transposase